MVERLLVWTLCLTLLLCGYFTVSAIQSSNRERRKQSIHAALNGGSMSTPEGFRKACGEPRWTRTVHGTLLFDYDNGLLVAFPNRGPVQIRWEGPDRMDREGMPADENWLTSHLQCNP